MIIPPENLLHLPENLNQRPRIDHFAIPVETYLRALIVWHSIALVEDTVGRLNLGILINNEAASSFLLQPLRPHCSQIQTTPLGREPENATLRDLVRGESPRS
jgi:hypothetical protein